MKSERCACRDALNVIFGFNDQGDIQPWRQDWDMGSVVQQQLGISAGEMAGYMEQSS